MDPLTHTLVGATLAKSGLERRSALALPTLVIGANLPDIDAFATFLGDDFSLAFRRGWTHGVPALLILPLILTGAMVLFHRRFRQGKKKQEGPKLRPKQLLFLSYLSVWSHPALDWLNTYGIRLLMPFDGTWFYGDALFIVDPWVWLLLGGVMFLITSKTRRRRIGWGVLALLTSTFVGVLPFLLRQGAPTLVPILWFGALAGLIFLRRKNLPTAPHAGKVAFALSVAGLYVGLMIAGTVFGEKQVRKALLEQGMEVQEVMVGPVPFNPLRGEIVVEVTDGYRLGGFNWLQTPNWQLEEKTWPKPASTPVVEAAMAAPNARGFIGWARFPIAEVFEEETGYRVFFRDLRYTQDREGGFGTRLVKLDQDLNPVL